MVFEGILL